MCTMLVVLFYLHQQKENYRMMGAFTRKSLVKVESKRKRKKNLGFNGLIVQNLKIVNKKIISKLFVRHSSGDERRNKGKKILIYFVIKLNEDDWMFQKHITTRDQRKSFKL